MILLAFARENELHYLVIMNTKKLQSNNSFNFVLKIFHFVKRTFVKE